MALEDLPIDPVQDNDLLDAWTATSSADKRHLIGVIQYHRNQIRAINSLILALRKVAQ
jgi:hypothetical protein